MCILPAPVAELLLPVRLCGPAHHRMLAFHFRLLPITTSLALSSISPEARIHRTITHGRRAPTGLRDRISLTPAEAEMLVAR